MCRIKYGKAISNNEDIRNLIAGIILRQRKEFYRDNIFNITNYYLQGTSMVINDRDIKDMIDNSLDVFRRNGEVRCQNGKFLTVGID